MEPTQTASALLFRERKQSRGETCNILTISTLGHGSIEEHRICELLSAFSPDVLPFDRQQKWRSFTKLSRAIRRLDPDLIVMEGTGIAGGLALILARLIWGCRYVVSSGDAVGPWVGSHYRLLGPLFTAYEKLLCRWSSGFIGWTPYLVGRALTFGAPRAMTAAGWAPFSQSSAQLAEGRTRVRASLGIPPNAVVAGIAGSLIWSKRYRYCYGLELVRAMERVVREDVYAVIVGDGTGMAQLGQMVKDRNTNRVIFTGRVPQSEIPDYLAAMDIGSLPQSVDQTGSFRYTTKISEYIDCRLPMVTGQVPMGYDLDDGWLWRMPGNAPWDEAYIRSLAEFLQNVTPGEINAKRTAIPVGHPVFDKEIQVRRVTAFIEDILAGGPSRQPGPRPEGGGRRTEDGGTEDGGMGDRGSRGSS